MLSSESNSEHQTNPPLKRNFDTTMKDHKQPTPNLLDVFNMAMERNTIAHLDGAGKTVISVMIIKEIALSLSKHPSEKKLIIFLAPTCNLVEQAGQFNDVRVKTDLLVDFYHESKVTKIDGKSVDEWDAATWQHETNKNLVMVMTPQILLDALRNGFINFEMICLLIIDECRHAGGNHPYASIMKEYYFKSLNKPKVFGMTTSQVTKKAVSSDEDCEALESIFDSLVYTTQDRTEVESVTPSASLKYSFYESRKVDHVNLKLKLKCSRLKFEVQLLEMQLTMQRHYKGTQEKHAHLRERLSDDHDKIIYCIDELGLLCAYEAAKICLAKARKSIPESGIFKDSSSKCSAFLEESLSIITNYLPNGHENMFHANCDFKKMVAAAYISPKLYHLFTLFLSFGGATKATCLIFVERLITAEVVDMILKKVADLSQFKASYLTGNSTSVDAMSAKLEKETLESFHSGKVDLLFVTDFTEEGVDLPKCSTVILFNIPKRVRQSGSRFIIMLERSNEEQRERVCDILRSDHSMDDNARNRDPDTCAIHDEHPSKNKSTKKAKGSPSVAILKSINTQKGGPRASLFELCCKMKWSTPVLTSSEEKSKSFNSFESSVSLTFPDCGVIEVTGEPRADKKSSLDSAALLMLYELQKSGKLKIGEESE